MAKTATLVLGFTASGDGIAPFQWSPATAPSNATSPVAHYVQSLSAGNNPAITIPTGSVGVWLVPSTTNSVLVTFKGVSGDTGIATNKTIPTFMAFDSSQATFVLNAGSSVTVDLYFV